MATDCKTIVHGHRKQSGAIDSRGPRGAAGMPSMGPRGGGRKKERRTASWFAVNMR